MMASSLLPVAELEARNPQAVVIGGSAGTLDAMARLLPGLPPGLPAGVVVVVHVPPGRSSSLVTALAGYTSLPVVEAEDKMDVRSGTVYVAPPDYHLLFERDGSLALSADEPVHFSRPSIDVLFESAAYALDRRVLGILLSGASADGARGLALIRARGGATWVQLPASAAVALMPQEALALAPHTVLEPRDMGRALALWAGAEPVRSVD